VTGHPSPFAGTPSRRCRPCDTMFSYRTCLAAWAAALALAAATPAAANNEPMPAAAAPAADPSADSWLRIGLERYERGDLTGAIEAFENGHARDARPLFLFALGQAHRRRGDCARARALFDSFLATAPNETQAAAAREQRRRCEVIVPAPVAAAPAPAPWAPARTRSLWADPVAVGAGALVLLGGSAALWVSARRAADDAAAAETYDRHRALRERAASRELWAAVSLGAGTAAAAVTVWRLLRVERPADGVAWYPMSSADQLGMVVRGTF
jgi:tetratricopeptide (TPR) repeat protein